MIALWLPLWSLVQSDQSLIFLILVFTFFLTISLFVKFKSNSNMSCVVTNQNFFSQEAMTLTRNPFQVRLNLKVSDIQTNIKEDYEENKETKIEEINEDNKEFIDTEKDYLNNQSTSLDSSQNIKKNLNEKDLDDENLKEDLNDENLNEKDLDDENLKEDLNDENLNEEDLDDKSLKEEDLNDKNLIEELNKDLNDENSFAKNLNLDILCKIDYYVFYFWGVNIDQFHNFMRLNSKSFKQRLLDGTIFEENYLERNDPILVKGSNETQTLKLTCSEKVNSQNLGQSPRAVYPLVVILAQNFENEEEILNKEEVAFMINVIHIKDDICPLETNIITRLLKKINGLTINLQTLYTPDDSEDLKKKTALCVICQENFVSIALLPCKHTCICLECFNQIDKCPLCRSYIKSYFTIEFDESKFCQEENNQEIEESEKKVEKLKSKSFFKKLNIFKF